MLESVTCFACEQEPEQQCPRCGRPYCNQHGEELCDACLQPASGVPSFTLYRGSLLALLVGTALAVWLLIQPGDGEGEGAFRPLIVTPTSAEAANVTPEPGTTPDGPGVEPTTAGPGEPVETSTPADAGGPANNTIYTVVSGDSLSAICEQLRPASMTVTECVDQVVLRNGLSSPDDISIGEDLLIPQ